MKVPGNKGIGADQRSGVLALVGGGDFEESERVDRRLLELAGGVDAQIVFLPTAHPSRRVGEKFKAYYQKLGARDVSVVPVYDRKDANDDSSVQMLQSADLIFIGWGSDTHLLEAVKNTPIQRAIENAFQGGAVLAGTSAGARAAGELVISPANGPVGLRGGVDFGLPDPEADQDMEMQTNLRLWPGFGWLPGVGIEAHLSEWNRYGHLLALGALHPDFTWVGLDEGTGLILDPDGYASVVGRGNVIVTKPSLDLSTIVPNPHRSLEAKGLRLDILSDGSRIQLSELFGRPSDGTNSD